MVIINSHLVRGKDLPRDSASGSKWHWINTIPAPELSRVLQSLVFIYFIFFSFGVAAVSGYLRQQAQGAWPYVHLIPRTFSQNLPLMMWKSINAEQPRLWWWNIWTVLIHVRCQHILPRVSLLASPGSGWPSHFHSPASRENAPSPLQLSGVPELLLVSRPHWQLSPVRQFWCDEQAGWAPVFLQLLDTSP